MREIWVLWHFYGDGSGAHLERAYFSEARAREDFDLLTKGNACKTSTSEWKLDKVTLVPGGPLP